MQLLAAARPRLYGRDTELSALLRGFDAVERGQGQMFLLCGEPGIGKSRVADELAAAAEARGALVLFGAAWDGGGAPALWPWVQVVRALRARLAAGDTGPSAALRRDLGPLWESEGSDAAAAIAPDRDPELAQFRLCDALRALLQGFAARAPLLVVLDDLHAADRASLLALLFVARSLRGLRVLFLATYRPEDALLRTDLSGVFERIARAGERIDLAPLDRAAVGAWLAELEPISSELIDRVHGTSGGNPLFIGEMLRLLRSGAGTNAVPDGVRAVVAERLARFEADSLAVLEAAALLGRELPLGLLAPLCELSSGELARRLRLPQLAGVVAQLTAATLNFSHPLFRECLLERVAGERATRLHLRAAELLLQRDTGDGASAAEAARHLLLALPTADAPRALQQTLIAARRCRRELAFDRALELLEQASSALAGSEVAEALRAELDSELAQALLLAGFNERSRRVCSVAAERARRMADGVRLAQAALCYGTELRIGMVDPAHVAMLEDALALLGDTEPALRARVLGRLAAARQPAPDPSEPIALALQAIALARETADEDALRETLYSTGSALAGFAPPRQRRALSRELAHRALAKGELLQAQWGYQRWAFDAAEVCDFEELDIAIAGHLQLGAALGQARFQWEGALLVSMRHLIAGRFAESAAAIERASHLAEECEAYAAKARIEIHRIGAYRASLRGTPEAYTALRQVHTPQIANPGPPMHDFMEIVTSASVYARLGDAVRARRMLDGVSQLAASPQLPAIAHANLLDAAARCGHSELCRAILPKVMAADSPALTWNSTGFIWDGLSSELIGRAHAALEEWAAAQTALEEAVATADALGARPCAVESRLELAHVLMARHGASGGERVAQLLDEAEAAAAELGMTASLARANQLRARHAARLVSDPPSQGQPVFSLQREGEVWSITCADRTARFKHSRALELLEQLVEQPGREFHVLELGMLEEPGALIDRGDSGTLIDAAAAAAYRTRIAALQAELAEAAEWNDGARRERARAECEFLEEELARTLGVGGRLRRSAAAAERARVNVQKRLRGLIRRIEAQLPELGSHLQASIRTGLLVSYRAGHGP